MEVKIRVTCVDLPGDEFVDARAGSTTTYSGVHLGIQRGDEVVDAVPAGSKRATFAPVFRVAPLPDGGTNFLGPFAKGTPGERFFYLSWLATGPGGTPAMFRRAKIHLSHLPWPRVEEAARRGRPLSVELSMTDARGGPLCASVRWNQARWAE